MIWSIVAIKGMAQTISGYVYLSIAYLFSCVVAGYIQAWVARAFGDDVEPTLDPISYIDPIGFIALCFFYIGWGRPVPINPQVAYYYRYPWLVLLAMYGVPALVHFVLSGLCYLLIKSLFGSFVGLGAAVSMHQLSSLKRVTFALLIFSFYYNVVQTVFTAFMAVLKVIITNITHTREEGLQFFDYILLMLVPMVIFFLFGDIMITAILKIFILIEYGIKMILGAA